MTFNELVQNVKKFEGFRSYAYDDLQPNIKNPSVIKGTLTIGYGRTQNVKLGDTTTEEQEEKWLIDRLQSDFHTVQTIMQYNNYEVSTDFLYALTDFIYNCGKANFMKLIDYGNRTEQEIIDNIVKYNKAGGKVLKGLIIRRQFEQDLMLLDKNRYKNMTVDLQVFLNNMIQDYNLNIDLLTQDGIYGNKTDTALNYIIDIIKK